MCSDNENNKHLQQQNYFKLWTTTEGILLSTLVAILKIDKGYWLSTFHWRIVTIKIFLHWQLIFRQKFWLIIHCQPLVCRCMFTACTHAVCPIINIPACTPSSCSSRSPLTHEYMRIVLFNDKATTSASGERATREEDREPAVRDMLSSSLGSSLSLYRTERSVNTRRKRKMRSQNKDSNSRWTEDIVQVQYYHMWVLTVNVPNFARLVTRHTGNPANTN